MFLLNKINLKILMKFLFIVLFFVLDFFSSIAVTLSWFHIKKLSIFK